MPEKYIRWGAILGALAVALGAFGAHGLKALVPEETQHSFHTGVEYQFYHTGAILITGLLLKQRDQRQWRTAALLFLIGIILFSGSLYALTLLKATDTVGLSGIGIITPVGGLAFIAGWIFLLLGSLAKKA